jgi:hypothetical protein
MPNDVGIFGIVARCHIKSIAPMCQSRMHGEPFLEGESDDAYDLRTWRRKMHVTNGTVHIPAKAIHDTLIEGAKYSKIKIKGARGATWTARFTSGIALFDDPDLGIDPQTVDFVPVNCHVNGNPKSGARVLRRFPTIPKWESVFDVQIMDPMIDRDIFAEILKQAGLFVGIGQNRPQNRGSRGRFSPVSVDFVGDRSVDQRRLHAA